VITPNEDGKNDFIDYSSLAVKTTWYVIFSTATEVRYSRRIRLMDINGMVLPEVKIPTGNYWYEIGWNEPNNKQTAIKYTGWIMVKNRE
jgi:hypothetical protein